MDDIARTIMNQRKLAKLRTALRAHRLNPIGIRPRELVSIASKLGRTKKSGFTNEPTYVRTRDPQLTPPLSIPAHSELKPGTARSIIDALLDDCDDWEQYLLEHGDDSGNDDDDDI